MNFALRIAAARILRCAGEFILLVLLTIIVPVTLYIDAVVLRNGISETSLTELSQDVLVFASSVLFLISAWQRPDARGFFTLVGGFLACMFIRELDFAFDYIRHGFWVCPAMLVAVVCCMLAVRWRDSILTPMAAYADTKSYIHITIGLLIVISFSRTFGSGQLLWAHMMGADYKAVYKAAIQEGLELFGYVFIFYGALLEYSTLQDQNRAMKPVK